MNSKAAVRRLQIEILSVAVQKLGRALTDDEQRFVTSRGGFLALEAILDTVRSAPATELEHYLHSDADRDPHA